MIKVKVSTILSIKNVIGEREFEVLLPEGSTVKDLIAWMINKWGEKLSSHLFHPETNQPLSHIRFMVNGRLIEFLNGMETDLKDGDEFLILPVVAGG